MAQQQLVTFELSDQVLGVDIMAIREIRAWAPATPLPNVPSHVRGVVNLRGAVLPVLDLSQLIGWGQTEPSPRHVIIVVQVAGQLQGFIVDAVNDIVSIDLDALQPPPELGTALGPHIVEGIVNVDDRLVMVLAVGACKRSGFCSQTARSSAQIN